MLEIMAVLEVRYTGLTKMLKGVELILAVIDLATVPASDCREEVATPFVYPWAVNVAAAAFLARSGQMARASSAPIREAAGEMRPIGGVRGGLTQCGGPHWNVFGGKPCCGR